MSRRGLLIDFGGVLTSNVFDAFAAFCRSAGLAADAFVTTLREEPEAASLLVQVETGAMSEPEFERRFAPILGRRGNVAIHPEGLLSRLSAALEPDPEMLALVDRVRGAGHPLGLVSNSFGMAAYDGYGLEDRFDEVILSGEVGMRKPSRRIYLLAAQRLGVAPERCVFVDDLAQNITGAERAGMRGLLHRHPPDTVAALESLFALAPPVRS